MAALAVAALLIALPAATRAQEPTSAEIAPGVTLELAPAPEPVSELPPPPAEDGLPPPNLRPPGDLQLPPAPRAQLSDTELAGAPRQGVVADDTPDPRAGNVLAEFFVGLLGYAIGGLAGGGLAALAIENGNDVEAAVGVVTGFVIAGCGIALGVDLGGDSSGGNGDFWAAFVGQVLGGLASFALLAATFASSSRPDPDGTAQVIGVLGVIVLPVAGATIGYTLTDSANR